VLTGGESEILYTYDSRNDFYLTEGKPVAWRYSGPDYEYVFFELPLSFMDRPLAKTVLQTALAGMLSSGPAALCGIDPDTLDESAGLPPTVAICIGDFADGHTAEDINTGTIMVNSSLPPESVTILPSHPDFTSEVLQITLTAEDFVNTYNAIVDTVSKVYQVSWIYDGESTTRNVFGPVVLIGQQYLDGDANGDRLINVADAVYIINFVFKNGDPPDPLEAGDANCDGSTDVGDAVFLINYIFHSGPPPDCD
jgi:hypothetical protein